MSRAPQGWLPGLLAVLWLGCAGTGDPAVAVADLQTDFHEIFQWRLDWENGWDALAGVAVGDPAIARTDDGSVNVFVLGTDRGVYQRRWDGTQWSGYAALGNGGQPLASLSATAVGNDMWIVGRQLSTGNVVSRMWNGATWSPWQNLGGVTTGTPTALGYLVTEWYPAYRIAPRVVVVARNSATELWSIQGDDHGSFDAWQFLQGHSDADPALTSWGVDRFDVVVKGLSNEIFHTFWAFGSWYGSWVDLGGWAASAPALTAWGPNRLDIVVDWGDLGSLRHKAWDGNAWTGWESLGGVPWSDLLEPLAARPTIASPQPGSLEVMVQGTDRGLYHNSFDGTTLWTAWNGWSQLAPCMKTHGTPAIASDHNGNMDLALLDHDRASWHVRYDWHFVGAGGSVPPACSCGGDGQECCRSEDCGDRSSWLQCTTTVGLEITQTCQPCGGYDQPACWGLGCQPGLFPLIPLDGVDVRCAPQCGTGPGTPCCPHDYEGLHRGCGDPTQTLLACSTSSLWDTGECASCGHPGEDCCNYWVYGGVLGGICQSGATCHARPGGGTPVCTADAPHHCGKLFEPCCNTGALCQPGEGTCSGGYCVIPPSPRQLAPNLTLGAPMSTTPTIVHASEPFTLEWLTCNRGNIDADSSHDSVFLDADQVDVEPVDLLHPGQCVNESHTFADGLSLGHHQIIVYIDAFNEADESDESDNSPEWNLFVQ